MLMDGSSADGRAPLAVAAVWTTWLALGGCVGSKPAQALYAGPEMSPSEVAELHGIVEHVDGQRVSGGKFALLPGCHIVRPPTKAGESSPQGAAWTTLPELHYSIMMVAGHRYQIAVRSGHMDGTGSGRAMLEATETDPAGALIHTFNPLAGPGAPDYCERESALSTVSVTPPE